MSKPTISELMANLSPEDLADILEAIAKKGRDRKGQGEKQKKRKQHRQKKLITPNDPEFHTPNQQPPQGRTRPIRRVQEFDVHEHRKNRSKGRKSGVQCRTESIQTGPRPNEFNRMRERNAHKNDVKIDKKLAGNNELTERRPAIEYIEMRCKRCNRWFDVLPSECYTDRDEGLSYICDTCAMEKAPEV